MRTVTLDTSVADCTDVIEAAKRRGLEVFVVTLTDREMRLSDYRPGVDARILDTFVLGDSEFGTMVFASETGAALIEQILRIISNGSFPKSGLRNDLTQGQRHQLRDALILAAHVRECHDIFVSDDKRAFVNKGRREKLEHLLSTRIMTASEFLQWAEEAPLC
jgi:hypothetical protein